MTTDGGILPPVVTAMTGLPRLLGIRSVNIPEWIIKIPDELHRKNFFKTASAVKAGVGLLKFIQIQHRFLNTPGHANQIACQTNQIKIYQNLELITMQFVS